MLKFKFYQMTVFTLRRLIFLKIKIL